MHCTVVIPVHNRERLVARAIESVLRQTHSDWELIVVDDGSTDGTEAVVAPFLSDRIRYIKQAKNVGAAASRNLGARNARAPLVTFLDSDDEAEARWLELMLSARLRQGAEVVCCGLSEFDSSGRLVSTHLPRDMGPLFEHRVGRFTHGSDYLLPTSLFLELGGFDEALPSGQHTEFAMRLVPLLAERGREIANVMEPLIHVHLHGGARIRTNWNAMRDGHAAVARKHERLFQKDRRLLANYLSIAGVCSVRTRRFADAKVHFRKAIAADPWKPVRWARFIVAQLPFLRSRVWS